MAQPKKKLAPKIRNLGADRKTQKSHQGKSDFPYFRSYPAVETTWFLFRCSHASAWEFVGVVGEVDRYLEFTPAFPERLSRPRGLLASFQALGESVIYTLLLPDDEGEELLTGHAFRLALCALETSRKRRTTLSVKYTSTSVCRAEISP